jgi:hypothetical protein
MVLFHMTEFKQGPRGNFTHIFFDMQSRYAHLYNSIIFMVVGHVSILQESRVLTHHTGIPAPFSRPLGTVARCARVLNSSLATGQRWPTPVFAMCDRGGTCGVGHVWRAGGREIPVTLFG